MFGWVFASHMVGAAVAASVSGVLRSATGDYLSAWLIAGTLAILAGLACLAIPRPVPARPEVVVPV